MAWSSDEYKGFVESSNKNVGQIMVFNYNYGLNDKVAAANKRRQEEQLEKDD